MVSLVFFFRGGLSIFSPSIFVFRFHCKNIFFQVMATKSSSQNLSAKKTSYKETCIVMLHPYKDFVFRKLASINALENADLLWVSLQILCNTCDFSVKFLLTLLHHILPGFKSCLMRLRFCNLVKRWKKSNSH